MNVSRFQPQDLQAIDLQPDQVSWARHGSPEYAERLLCGPAFTARVGGEVIACAGVYPLTRDEGIVWSFLARTAGRHMIALHRAASRLFEVSTSKRLFANCECDFAAAHRWLELLGFSRLDVLDTPAPDGRAQWLYVRGS